MVDIRQPLRDSMHRKTKRGQIRVHPKPYYDLGLVKSLVRVGKVLLRENALDGARDAFGWNSNDIYVALLALELKHFYKKEESLHDRKIILDFYKARGLKGENVYTHFYINDETGKLVVNSFKEI